MDDMEALGGRLVPMSSRLSNDKSAPRSLVSNFDFDKGEANIDDAEGPSGQVLSKSFERNLHENLFNSVPQGSDDHARRLSTLSDPDKSTPLQFLGVPLHKHMTKQDCQDLVDNVEEIGHTPYRQKMLLGFKDLYSLGGYEMQSLTKLQVLILPNNKLSSIPPSFGSGFGSSLRSLCLAGNYLKSLPTSLFQSLGSVEEFDVRFNLLENLNKVMLKWNKLSWLGLTGNYFTKLPAWLVEFTSLYTIHHEWGLLHSYHACRHAQMVTEEDSNALDWNQATLNMQKLRTCMRNTIREHEFRLMGASDPMITFEDYLESIGSDPFYYGQSELPSLIQEVVKYGLLGFVRGVLEGKAHVSRFILEKIYQYSVMHYQNDILTTVIEHGKDKEIMLIQNHSGYGSFNPLFFALKDPKIDSTQFKFLVQLGGDIHSVDMVGNNLLHILYQGLNMSGQKELQVLEFLLSRGVDPNAFNNCGFTPVLLAVYLSQHISWKHAFNWGWSDIGGQRKNCFDFMLANRITGKGVLHYTAFNAMLMVMLDRLALGVNELELDENLNLPSYYVPQGHITCKKCLALEEKSLFAKKFHAALNIGKPPLVQQASVSRTLSIRPVLRMSSKLNESASNLNKFSENESKVKADLSFNLSKKKFQDLDEMCKGMTELPQTSVQRIPLMPSDPSKKLLISSLRRSETDHDIGISRFMQNSALSNSGMKGMPPTPLKLSINHVPFPQRPIVIGGEQPHSSLSSSNNPLHSDRLTVNTVTANSQQAVHMLKRRKIKPDDASSQGSSYSSQALKTSAPLTNISPAKLVSRTNKDKIVANVTMVISRCLNTLSVGLAHLTTLLPAENPVTVAKHVHTSTGHLRQVLLALGLLERCLQSPFDLSTRGVCFVDFIDVLATAHKLTKAGLNWASDEEYKHRPAGEERQVEYIPNPSERRTAFLEMTAAGYGFPSHKDQATKVTDQSVLTCRLAVRQIFTIFGVLIQCMAKMHSFESTFKNRIKNFLEELRLIVETSGKYPNCAFRKSLLADLDGIFSSACVYKKLVEDSENKEDSSVRMRLQSMKHKIMGNKSVTASTGFRSTSAAIQKEPLRFNLERDVGPINLSKLHPS